MSALAWLRKNWLVVVVTLVGAGAPIAYFKAREYGWAPWIWPLYKSPLPRVAVALHRALPLFVLISVAAWWLEKRAPKFFRLAAAPLLVVGLTWLAYRYRNFYGPVGDGFGTWMKVADIPFIFGSEPLGFQILHFFNSHFGVPGRGSNLWQDPVRRNALELAAVTAGALCVTGTQFLVGKAFPNQSRWVITLALFVVPTWLVYAGYIESTPFAYAFTTLYLIAVLRYLELSPARAPWPESLLLAVALVTHGVACSITGAHAVLVGYWLFKKGPLRVGRLLIAMATALAPFVLLGATLWYAYKYPKPPPFGMPWYGNALGGHEQKRMFVPLDALSTARFWHERINLILFACPILLLAIPALVGLVRARRAVTAAVLGAALLGALGVELLWNVELIVFQDFDLLSLFAIPANLLVLKWLSLRLSPAQLRVSTSAIVAANMVFAIAMHLHRV